MVRAISMNRSIGTVPGGGGDSTLIGLVQKKF